MATLDLRITLARPKFKLEAEQTLEVDGIVAVFGPSASGKTTLLRTIAGLEPEARGRVRFGGTVWQDERSSVPTHVRGVGYVFQDGRLFPHLSVEGNLRFAERRAHAASSGGAVSFPGVVEALDLRELLARTPTSLSGGEQQRVAIARALLTRPRLLLMDEPLSALDLQRKREILPHIERLPSTFKVPVLYVTHNVDEVLRLANSVLLMSGGRILGHGATNEVFERLDPLSFGDALDVGAVLRTSVIDFANGTATLALGTQRLRLPMMRPPREAAVTLRIRARDVAIATARPEHLSIRNVLRARILRVDVTPDAHADILLDLEGNRLRSRITRDALDDLALKEGQDVFALIKSVAIESTLFGS
jgi:molybdate transport system ATP-binding protein